MMAGQARCLEQRIDQGCLKPVLERARHQLIGDTGAGATDPIARTRSRTAQSVDVHDLDLADVLQRQGTRTTPSMQSIAAGRSGSWITLGVSRFSASFMARRQRG